MFEHVVFGFCPWDIIAAVVLVAVVTTFAVHQRNHKKRMKRMEEQMK